MIFAYITVDNLFYKPAILGSFIAIMISLLSESGFFLTKYSKFAVDDYCLNCSLIIVVSTFILMSLIVALYFNKNNENELIEIIIIMIMIFFSLLIILTIMAILSRLIINKILSTTIYTFYPTNIINTELLKNNKVIHIEL